MKSILMLILVIATISCNNGGEAHHEADSTNVQTGGVENVNGNIPDTNSTLQLNEPLPVDSSRLKDSAH